MIVWSHLKDITIGSFKYNVYLHPDKTEIMVGLNNTNLAYQFPIENKIILWDKFPNNAALFSDELKEKVNELV